MQAIQKMALLARLIVTLALPRRGLIREAKMCRLMACLLVLVFGLQSHAQSRILLHTKQHEISAWQSPKEKLLDVTTTGELRYRCLFRSLDNQHTKNCGHADIHLSNKEMDYIKEFLTGKGIVNLDPEYRPPLHGTDYASSMEIKIMRGSQRQSVTLRGMSFVASTNNKLFPPAVHDLVCKVFGLQQRAGVHYGKATSWGPNREQSDDTWCDERSLSLIKMAASLTSAEK